MAQVRIQHSFDTEANWTEHNPSLREGEMVLSKDESGNIKLVVGDTVGGVNYNDAPVVWDKEEADNALSTITTTTATLSGRLDEIEAAGTMSEYYVQCSADDADALLIVASDPSDGQIAIADVTPHLSTYTPTEGDYVCLVQSVVGSEVADIRVDVDGTIHISAGAAIRAITSKSLRRIAISTETEATNNYNNTLANLPAMTVCYINTAWFNDAPQIGYAWIYTYGADSTAPVSAFGYQYIFSPFSGASYVRVYQDSEWKDWKENLEGVMKSRGALANNTDLNTISVQGIYTLTFGNTYTNAPPVTSGGLLQAYNTSNNAQTRVQIVYEFIHGDYWYRRGILCGTVDEEWTDWEYNGERRSLHRINITEAEASTVYSGLLANINAMTICYINADWFDDAPQSGYAWITTYGDSSNSPVSTYGYQVIDYVFAGISYIRYYSSGEWKDWKENPVGMLTGRGSVTANRNLNEISIPGVYVLTYGTSYNNAPPVTSGGLLLSLNSSADTKTRIQIVYEFIGGDYWYRRGILCGTENETWNDWSHHGKDLLGTGTYLAFGDSITQGVNNTQVSPATKTAYKLPDAVAKVVGLTVTNKGVGGQGVLKAPTGSKNGYETLVDNELLLSTADLITLAWGINDTTYSLGTPADSAETNTICGRWNKILAYVKDKAPNAQIIVITPLRTASKDWDDTFASGWSIDDYNTAVETICDTYNVPCLTWKKCCIANNIADLDNSYDGVHPTDYMYKRLGAYLAGQVSQYFKNTWNL